MKKLTGAIVATLLASTVVSADPVDDNLVLNDETPIVTRAAAPAHVAKVFMRAPFRLFVHCLHKNNSPLCILCQCLRRGEQL